jgi:CDP-diacylglycerol--glycerol-3-phosphate 3-phosphatidyltransferase
MSLAEPYTQSTGKLARTRWRHIPNALTWGRIVLSPLVVVAVMIGFHSGEARVPVAQWLWLGTTLFVIAAILDWVDGWAARMLQAQSDYGRMLDAIADKIATGAALALLLVYGAPGLGGAAFLPLAAIILGRDAVVNGLRAEAAREGRSLPSTPLAKVKTVVEFVSLALLLGGQALGAGGSGFSMTASLLGYVLLWGAALGAATTGLVYLRQDLQARQRSG